MSYPGYSSIKKKNMLRATKGFFFCLDVTFKAIVDAVCKTSIPFGWDDCDKSATIKQVAVALVNQVILCIHAVTDTHFLSCLSIIQTCQPPNHANLERLKKSPEKPGDWDLKPGDFQNMC